MKISCPTCFSSYKVLKGSIGEGRKVKCGTCGHRWFQDNSKKVYVNQELVLIFVFFAFFSVFIILFHEVLPFKCSHFVCDTKISNLLNIKCSSGIKFSDLNFFYMNNNEDLFIDGAINNYSKHSRVMPDIRISFRDVRNKKVNEFKIKSNGKIISPNSQENFQYKLLDISSDFDKIVLDLGNKMEMLLR